MMCYGIHVFLLLPASCLVMFRCVSGTTSYSASLQKKVVLWHGTRIILTGQEPSLLRISPSGAALMILLKKMVASNMFPAVIAGDCLINPSLRVIFWALQIILLRSN